MGNTTSIDLTAAEYAEYYDPDLKFDADPQQITKLLVNHIQDYAYQRLGIPNAPELNDLTERQKKQLVVNSISYMAVLHQLKPESIGEEQFKRLFADLNQCINDYVQMLSRQ